MTSIAKKESTFMHTHRPLAGIVAFAGQKKAAMIWSVALSVLSVVGGLMPYWAVSSALVGILDGYGASPQAILSWTGIALLGYILKIALYGRATLLSHRATFEILKNIRSAMAEKLARTPLGYLQSRPSGVFKQLIVDEVEKLEYPLAHAVPELTSNLLGPILIAAYLFAVDWRIALLALVSIPLGMVIYVLMMAGRGAMYEGFTAANDRMNAAVVEYVNGIEVVKVFGREASSWDRYECAVSEFRDLALRWYRHCWPYLSGYAVIMPAGIAAVLPVGAAFYAEGSLGLGALLSGIILTLGIAEPVMKLVEFSDNLVTIVSTEASVRTMLDVEELAQPCEPAVLQGCDIEFRQVSFSYGDERVLHEVSFTAREGTVTALVGPSGSGKSTIARLIARFWDADAGRVSLGGVDVRDMPVPQLMDNISYVSQDNFLLDVSIRENIRIGRPDATDAQIEQAAEQAGAAGFVHCLPQGFETRAGDAGQRLSGGERQRIAIARAILKDAPVVLLDEATAYADPESEDKIQRSIGNLVRGKTLIMIAHRLSTVMHADRILVVDGGRIVAGGTHDQLLEESELYQNMWQAHQEAQSCGAKEEVRDHVAGC